MDNQNLDLLIVKVGQYYSQYELEYLAEKINEQMDSIEYINSKYGYFFKHEILKTEILSSEIT